MQNLSMPILLHMPIRVLGAAAAQAFSDAPHALNVTVLRFVLRGGPLFPCFPVFVRVAAMSATKTRP